MKPVGVGFSLHPETEYLTLCRPIIEEEADFFEVVPETLWQIHQDGSLSGSPWWDLMQGIRQRSGKPFVCHGLGLSPGTSDATADEARLAHWLDQLRRDQQHFEFLWYTEHLGWMEASGLVADLPLPLPPTEESVRTVARRLQRLQPIIPLVGFENQVSYFAFTDIRTEAGFWNRICQAGDLWLLLDLHNCYTQCVNFGVPLDEYLAGLDLSRVIEVHLSGGSESEPGWLPSGRVMRLDSHDGPVPEPVWQAFASIRPRCPNLRGVVVERLDGSIQPDEMPLLRDEVRRARRIFWEG
ncbi:MAG: DUF692 family protein [Planctomycetia bacterium]|nr:DUF692 family protein [Planctomycetia bacterium]